MLLMRHAEIKRAGSGGRLFIWPIISLLSPSSDGFKALKHDGYFGFSRLKGSEKNWMSQMEF